jgi:hypothetical protein
MSRFGNAAKVGLRDKNTRELIAVYPFPPIGEDAEIEKAVRDWYYQQSCAAEDKLLSSFVDVLTAQETRSRS